MKQFHWKQLFIGILVEVGSISVYRLIQQLSPGKYDLSIPLDSMIPFWPSWIWIYLSVLPFFLYAALTLNPPLFHLTLKRVVTAHVLSYPFFMLIPSDYPRNLALDPDTFYGWGYGLMHSIDQPNNTFPSLHVSLTWVIMHQLTKNGMPAWFAYGYACVISVSTLITKQHYSVDVVGGVGIFLLTLILIKHKSPKDS